MRRWMRATKPWEFPSSTRCSAATVKRHRRSVRLVHKTFAVTALMMLVAMAGCLDTNDTTSVADPNAHFPSERLVMPEDPMPEGPGHDHTDASQHKFLWNYEFTQRDPLLGTEATASAVHALDLQNGFLFGAIYGSNAVSINGGMQIWDLEDPANPVARGSFNVPGAVGGDRSIGATSDGNYVVFSAEAASCFGHVNPVPISAYLIDVRDKDFPVVADVISVPGPSLGSPDRIGQGTVSLGEHSTYVQNIGGIDYAFIQGKIFEIQRTEQTATLVDTGASVTAGHDIYIRQTPTGDTWALAANGGGGLQIYNLNDPLNPWLMAVWNLPDRSNLTEDYYFHTADVAWFEDGDVIVILSSEDWLDHVSPMWILDGAPLLTATEGEEDVPSLEQIGIWTNPGEHTALGTSFSLHNPRFHTDGILTMSSYHGGLWQLDFRHPSFRADPAEIAYAVFTDGEPPAVEDPVFDTVETALCGLGLTIDAPTYMDVEVHEETGTLYAADVFMGLYTFKPSADHVAYGSGGMQSLN